MTISLHWFRRDLRLHDNSALAAAVSSSATTYTIFCASDLLALNTRQQSFAAAALRQLSAALGKVDASLSVLEGDPVAAVATATKRLGATKVFCARAFDRREREIERRVSTSLQLAGVELRLIGGPVVHEPEVVAEQKQSPKEGYRVFPPFYDAWKTLAVDRPLDAAAPNGRDAVIGAIPEIVAPAGPQPKESTALDSLTRFVTARAGDYGVNAEYPGRSGTSSLAAYLRFGILSPRTVCYAVKEKMARSWTLAQERLSMEAYLRRLALRDFYIHLAYYEPRVFDEPLQEKMRGFPWSENEELAAIWRAGKTGYPLVDAAMRQLNTEGHVHQRGAVVAASFCTADLGLDWRIGRDTWMQELVAADEALCVGNWQRIAGIGSDQAAYPRIYNPVRQAQLFDSQATYIRRYCKELAKLPTRAALAPWEIGKQQQIELGFYTPQQYPAPVVDHDVAARAFLAQYQNFRNRAS
ncbi:MAG TPA: deoxyribodipyrimidine photo-lyase [Candidatus Eremiobacteraceae bacterium]|nr:deoxyribodipyrimidine photo-lyase [Candidatus Eremiobacteraceae bacterium]